jgi:hypothetical protein
LHGTFNTNVGIVQKAEGGMGIDAAVVAANKDLFAPEASIKLICRKAAPPRANMLIRISEQQNSCLFL